MDNTSLANYIVYSHGEFDGNTFVLPKNVRVIMMSKNVLMSMNNHNTGKSWLLGLSDLTHDLKIISGIPQYDDGDLLDKMHIDEYLLNNDGDIKTFYNMYNCSSDYSFNVYSGNIPETCNCPNLSLASDNKYFRSGIFKMPIKLDRHDKIKNKITNVDTKKIKAVIYNNLKEKSIHNKGCSSMDNNGVISTIKYSDFGPLIGSIMYPNIKEYYSKQIDIANNKDTFVDMLHETNKTKIYDIVKKIIIDNPKKFVTLIIFSCRYTGTKIINDDTAISLGDYIRKTYRDNITYMNYDSSVFAS